MTLDLADLQDLELALGDRIYIQIESWRLFLGDASLSKALALECSALLDLGPDVAAKKALEAIKVSIAGGKASISLIDLIPSIQIKELSDILEPYCR